MIISPMEMAINMSHITKFLALIGLVYRTHSLNNWEPHISWYWIHNNLLSMVNLRYLSDNLIFCWLIHFTIDSKQICNTSLHLTNGLT